MVFNQSSQVEKSRYVSNGIETNMILSRQFNDRLSKPFSNCIDYYTLSEIIPKYTDNTMYPYVNWKCRLLVGLHKWFKEQNRTEEFINKVMETYSNQYKFLTFLNGLQNKYSGIYLYM